MIDSFVHVSLKNPTSDASIKRTAITKKSFTLNYPCTNTSKCVPYVLELSPGAYKFECWGSKGGGWSGNLKSKPGLGAYTAGTIFLSKSSTFYVYIGTTGLFNAANIEETQSAYGVPGAATDVRLNYSDDWFDTRSLLSRIMVAAGGGGAEWAGSIGGNGGDIEGGESISSLTDVSTEAHEEKCPGANQTSGSVCPSYELETTHKTYYSTPGTFGISGIPDISNSGSYGGFGGSGYYGGTSYDYVYAGSGGSSFVSGHKQCNAVKDVIETIEHSGDSVHYSGYVFNDPLMIPGNTTMPDPKVPTHEEKYNGTGAFRITLIHYQYHCTYTKSFFRHSIYLFLFIAK